MTRASPGVRFTRTGAANTRPPSTLVAAKMSVVPSGSAADQAAATKSSCDARLTLAFVRPGTASVDWDGESAAPRTRKKAGERQ